jgi:general secretion pathway protein A
MAVVPGRRPLLDLFPTQPLRQASPAPPPLKYKPVDLSSPPSTAAAPPYGHFYGLHEPPFADSSDLKFHYHGVEHDRVTQQMLAAIGRRDTLVILTGAPGVGKTMLCRALAEQLDRRTLTSFIAEPPGSITPLLKTVLVDFGVISAREIACGQLANATQAELASALREFLVSLLTLQAFAVLVVDQAQKLAPEMLEEIWKLTELGGDQALLQVVLVGRPELLGVVSRSSMRQRSERSAVKCKLGPLADDEIGGYVMHRLRVAGDHPRVDFDDEALMKIYSLTKGLPQTVNVLCDRVLQVGLSKSASTIDEALVDRAAEELDLAGPEDSNRQTFIVAALLALSLLAGAGVSALVYRADLAALFHR